jgi:hypothetical protein
MSVLAALDATTLCTPRPVAAEAWALPVLTYEPRPVTAPAEFSWWSLVRNPQALLLTGVITANLVRDALARAVAS